MISPLKVNLAMTMKWWSYIKLNGAKRPFWPLTLRCNLEKKKYGEIHYKNGINSLSLSLSFILQYSIEFSVNIFSVLQLKEFNVNNLSFHSIDIFRYFSVRSTHFFAGEIFMIESNFDNISAPLFSSDQFNMFQLNTFFIYHFKTYRILQHIAHRFDSVAAKN